MRKLGWILGIVAAVIVIAAGGGWLARHAVVAQAVRWAVAARGIDAVDLTVDTVDTRHVVIRDLALGRGDELTVRRLTVRFDLWQAVTRGLVDIAADGLVLRVDATGNGPLLGDLDVLMQKREAGKGGTVPPIAVSDGRVLAQTPAGPVTVAFDGDLVAERSGSLVGSANFEAESPYGAAGGRAGATVDAGGTVKAGLVVEHGDLAYQGLALAGLAGQVDAELGDGALQSLTGSLRTAAIRRGKDAFGGWNADLNVTPQTAEITFKTGQDDQRDMPLFADVSLRLDDYRQAPTLHGTAKVRVTGAGPWQAWTAPATWGGVTLDATVAGTLPPLDGGAGVGSVLAAADLTSEARVAVDGAAVPDVVRDGKVRMQANAGVRDGHVTIHVRPGSQLTGQMAHALAAKLPAEITPLFQDGITVSFGDGEDPLVIAATVAEPRHPTIAGPVRLSGQGAALKARIEDAVVDDSGLSGTIETDTHLDTVHGSWGKAAGVAVQGRAAVTAGRNGQWSAVATDPAHFAVQAFSGQGVTLRQPLTGTVDNAMAFSGDGLPVFSAAVTVPRLVATVPGGGDISLENARLQAKNSGRDKALAVKGAIAAVSAPGRQLAAQAIAFTASGITGGLPRTGTLTVGVLSDRHEPALVAPLKVTAALADDGTIRVDAADAWKRLHLTYAGTLKPSGDVAGTYALKAIKFDPQEFEIKDLFPFLKTLRDVHGTVEAGGRLGVVKGTPAGNGWLKLDGLSAVASGVSLRGLSGRIVADSLFPPRLPPGQTLTVDAINPAIPMTKGEIRFHMPGTTPPVVVIEGGGLDVAGGRVSLGKTDVDLSRPEQALTLQLDHIDLKQLLAVAPVKGLEVEGTVSGALPVAAGAKGWRVDHGALDAIKPGVIRFRSPEAAAALGQGGDAVKLMLQALEDFRYQDLKASVDKAADGSTTLALSLLGHNPAVLDGHPFRFNINLEGNLNKVLLALRQGMALSDQIIRRGIGQ